MNKTGRNQTIPAVSVLMSVYQTPLAMLEQAVTSILQQTFEDFEFLILDDGSFCDSAPDVNTRHVACTSLRAVLERYAATDARVHLYFEPHRGLTRTLNRGLKLARGKYVARQDADDWSDLGRLKQQYQFLETHADLSVCGSNAWMHQQDGSRLWPTHLPETCEQIWDAFWKGNPFVHGSTMFLSAAAQAIGGYCQEFPCSQDYDFFWRLSEVGGAATLCEPLYHYRFTGGSVSVKRAAEQARVHIAAQILARARREGQSREVSSALAEAKRQLSAQSGWFHAALKQADHRLLAGDYSGSLGAYTRLLTERPADPLAWGKLARWGLFTGFPFLREASFRTKAAG